MILTSLIVSILALAFHKGAALVIDDSEQSLINLLESAYDNEGGDEKEKDNVDEDTVNIHFHLNQDGSEPASGAEMNRQFGYPSLYSDMLRKKSRQSRHIYNMPVYNRFIVYMYSCSFYSQFFFDMNESLCLNVATA